MDREKYFKTIYTVAFRLIGEEKMATEIAAEAITNTYKEFNEDTEAIVEETIIELMRIFLNRPSSYCKSNLKGIQGALLELKPVNRAIIIWKDVLGYQIHDNIPIVDCSYEKLSKELIWGRKSLKEYILNKASDDF